MTMTMIAERELRESEREREQVEERRLPDTVLCLVTSLSTSLVAVTFLRVAWISNRRIER